MCHAFTAPSQNKSLTHDPIATLVRLYEQLGLDGFPRARAEQRIAQSSQYQARNALPPAAWADRVRTQWRPVFEQYGYEVTEGPVSPSSRAFE